MSLLEIWTAIVTYQVPFPDVMTWDWDNFFTIGGLILLSLGLGYLEV